MTFQKHRPVDTVQRMMSSINHFERKLDKLQDDLKNQGQTLSELRLMVLNLSGGTIVNPDTRSDDVKKRPLKRTMAIQYDDKPIHLQDSNRIGNKKSVMQSSELKMKPKNLFQNQKCSKRLSMMKTPLQTQLYKMEANQIHMQRHRKADAVRKTNTIRPQKKVTENKLSKFT